MSRIKLLTSSKALPLTLKDTKSAVTSWEKYTKNKAPKKSKETQDFGKDIEKCVKQFRGKVGPRPIKIVQKRVF